MKVGKTASRALYNFCYFCMLLRILIKDKVSETMFLELKPDEGKGKESSEEDCPGCGHLCHGLRHNKLNLLTERDEWWGPRGPWKGVWALF